MEPGTRPSGTARQGGGNSAAQAPLGAAQEENPAVESAATAPKPAAQELPELPARLAQSGALVPVRVIEDEPGKFGYPSPVKWASEGPPSVEDWRANWTKWKPRPGQGVAIHLGRAGLMLVDLDCKNGHDGVTAYEAAFGDIPGTYTEATPTGGIHLLFRIHPALAALDRHQVTGLLDGVDVKWGNQIAVCAPTTRSDGAYIRVDESDGVVMPPQALVDLVLANLVQPADSKRSISEILAHGSDRGHRDMDVTRMVFWLAHRYGSGDSSREQVMREAQEWNRKNCRPPLSEDVVARKVARIFSAHKSRSGWMVTASAADPWETTYLATRTGDMSTGVKMTVRRGSGGTVTELDATAVSVFAGGEWRHLGAQMGLRVFNSFYRLRQAESIRNALTLHVGPPAISAAELNDIIQAVTELMAQDGGPRDAVVSAMGMEDVELPPEEWLIEDLIPRGVISILVGNGGVGKTTLALAMAHAVASGHEWSEDDVIVPNAHLPVFYYTAEDEWQNLVPRSKMLRMGRDSGLLQICDGITDDTSLFNRIRKVEAGCGEALRVIDSASAVFGDLNNNQAVVTFMRGLRLLGGSTIISAHISKGGLATGRNDPMGAIQWRNQARHALSIGYDPDDHTLINLTVEKHNGGLAEVGQVISMKRHVERHKTMWYGPALGRTTRSLLCAGIAGGHRAAADLYDWAESEHGTSRNVARKEKTRLVHSGAVVEIEKTLYLKHEAQAMALLRMDD